MDERQDFRERESSLGPIAEVIETKLDQLIESVREIKNVMHDNTVDISNLKLELNTIKNKTETQDEKIEELRKHNEVNKHMLITIATGVGVALVLGVLKLVAGVL